LGWLAEDKQDGKLEAIINRHFTGDNTSRQLKEINEGIEKLINNQSGGRNGYKEDIRDLIWKVVATIASVLIAFIVGYHAVIKEFKLMIHDEVKEYSSRFKDQEDGLDRLSGDVFTYNSELREIRRYLRTIINNQSEILERMEPPKNGE
jgi:hypothetical protein